MQETRSFGSVFSGIGGIDLGLERAGWTCRWQVENNPWCRRILTRHWPDIPRYGDIKELDPHDLEPVDLVCGGFPCQPVSSGGLRRAQDDPRWLWPYMAKVVGIVRPRFVLVENVAGLVNRGLGDVLADLANLGFDAEWEVLPAGAFGAPHQRRRLVLLAYPEGFGPPEQPEGTDTEALLGCGVSAGGRVAGRDHAAGVQVEGRDASDRSPDVGHGCLSDGDGWWATEPGVGRMADGVPCRVDRLGGLGNAAVPQLFEWIGQRIVRAGGDESRRSDIDDDAALWDWLSDGPYDDGGQGGEAE